MITNAEPSIEFDRLVFLSNNPLAVERIGDGRVCWSGPTDGPTHVSTRRENSDAAIRDAAKRFGLDADTKLAFRDASAVGDLIELAPHRLDS